MSDLEHRKNSPRYPEERKFPAPWRFAVLLYSTLPFIMFVNWGGWIELCATLGMIKLATLGPLR